MDECAICLEYLVGAIRLDCGHLYHLNCIIEINNLLCPLCRKPFTLKPGNLSNNFNFDKNNNLILNESIDIISQNYLIDIDYFINNPSIEWNWQLIIKNIIFNKYNKIFINWEKLTLIVPIDCIIESTQLPWIYNLRLFEFTNLFIIDNKNLNFDWYKLTSQLPIDFIIENKDLNFDWFIRTKEFEKKFIIDNKDLNFDWFIISKNLPIKFIIENKHLQIYWYAITNKLPITFIIENKHLHFNWYDLDERLEIPFIMENKYLQFDWFKLTNRLPIAFIIENKKFYFHWEIISNLLPIKFIIENKNLNFNWYDITNNLPIRFILKNDSKQFNWHLITSKISFKYIINDMNTSKKKWDWDYLSYNVPKEIIKKNIYLPWNKNILYKSRNLKFPKFIYYIFK